jgi:superfamily I DNA/RNA helicase
MSSASTSTTDEEKLQEAIQEVVRSPSRKKLVVAGPGTGKTTLFGELLDDVGGSAREKLILTFINALKDDLESSFADRATVRTLHGYCIGLLHGYTSLRGDLSEDFRCVPGLAHLIKSDWKFIEGTEAPQFVLAMRHLDSDGGISFYLARGDYYDAVYRVCIALESGAGALDAYRLVMVDEYQDFNDMEATIIWFLSQTSPIVIVGDDDQALYSRLRSATWDHIRSLYDGGEFDVFELPYCLRCPEVVVGAVNDILQRAQQIDKLQERIDKPYWHFAPYKGEDSAKYPAIAVIETTVQSKKVNYMGRFIQQAITEIPQDEIDEAVAKGFPAALVISPMPYRGQIAEYLESAGYVLTTRRDPGDPLDRERGLELLHEDPDCSVGWRILLECDQPEFTRDAILATADRSLPLVETLDDAYRETVLEQASTWQPVEEAPEGARAVASTDRAIPITVTSFEGAKGLSGQHVYVAGLHDGELPRDPASIDDLEICKFVVALTRTRKKCTLLHADRFGEKWLKPSVFISWIRKSRLQRFKVDKRYWRAQG